MNTIESLPDDVRKFLVDNIDSIPHLEALLLLWEQRYTQWTAQSLANALYVNPIVAKHIAHDFLRRGWLKLPAKQDEHYIFDDAWDPDGQFMQKLSATYRKQLIGVATLVHSKASAGVRDFAKAFDFKKD